MQEIPSDGAASPAPAAFLVARTPGVAGQRHHQRRAFWPGRGVSRYGSLSPAACEASAFDSTCVSSPDFTGTPRLATGGFFGRRR